MKNTTLFSNLSVNSVVHTYVQQMNEIFDTPEKRKYAAEVARIHLQTYSTDYSEVYAHLIKSIGLTSRIQEEYCQKLVAFYFHAKKVSFKGNLMLDDFVNNNGKLPHYFTSYC